MWDVLQLYVFSAEMYHDDTTDSLRIDFMLSVEVRLIQQMLIAVSRLYKNKIECIRI